MRHVKFIVFQEGNYITINNIQLEASFKVKYTFYLLYTSEIHKTFHIIFVNEGNKLYSCNL